MILCVCLNPSIDTLVYVDEVHAGRIHRLRREVRYPGGKAINVAKALAELGESVCVLGFWGGVTGDWIRSECQRRAIECIGPRVENWNRICQTFQTSDGFNETEFIGCGPDILPERLRELLDIYNRHLRECQVVVMSGSYPSPVIPPDFYQLMTQSAKAAGAACYIDAAGDPMRRALTAAPDVVHINLQEGFEVSGTRDPSGILNYFRQSSGAVSLTAGKNGMYFAKNKHAVHAHVEVEKKYSAVGCGDCLTAGLIASSRRNYDLAQTARLAVACGAANLLNEEIGCFKVADVDRLVGQVVVHDFDAQIERGV